MLDGAPLPGSLIGRTAERTLYICKMRSSAAGFAGGVRPDIAEHEIKHFKIARMFNCTINSRVLCLG